MANYNSMLPWNEHGWYEDNIIIAHEHSQTAWIVTVLSDLKANKE